MKLLDAEKIAKQRIRDFAISDQSLIELNKNRFVLHSWKGDDGWYITVSIFSKAAMAGALQDDSSNNRAADWIVVRVANDGDAKIEEVAKLIDLLKA